MSVFQGLIRHRHLLKLIVESALVLTLVKLQLLFLPYQKWHLKKAYFQCETLKKDQTQNPQRVKAIGQAISIAKRYLPWRAKCLDQALCAEYMLSRRNLASTLYFGMKKEGNEWRAHAWVRAGTEWVVGYDTHHNYTVVGTYASTI